MHKRTFEIIGRKGINPMISKVRLICDQAYKPGSVVDSHLSSLRVAAQLKPPWGNYGRASHPRSGVAPDRVCRAA
ncbi:hypothetical protein I4300191C4_01740 [Solibaculum mannosilyticum]